MSKRTQETKTKGKEEVEEEVKVTIPPEVIAKGEELKDEIDDLIDKIDDILQENAEEFVKTYIQKGGE